MTPPTVHEVTGPDRQRAYQTILLGFSADPLMRWFWPDASTYLHAMSQFIATEAEPAMCYATDGFGASAIWVPPDRQADDEQLVQLFRDTVDASRYDELFDVLRQFDENHPDEPHWYLPLIGADPSCVGQGLGSALMKAALARCDESGVQAYLESSNPRNITLYQRYGFEAVGEIQSGSSPVAVPMVRQPHN